MKLYSVTIERTIFVLAHGERDAEYEARHHENEDACNEPDSIRAYEVTDLARVPKVWRNCMPYGGDERQITCEAFLAQQVQL